MPVDWNWSDEDTKSGVVHQSLTNTDNDSATTLKQGYDLANFSEITPTPVAAYPCQENSGTTLYDVSGNGLNGTINGTTLGTTGLLGTTIHSYDGVDDYSLVDVGSTSPLNITGNSAVTVMAWVYPNDLSVDYTVICGIRGTASSTNNQYAQYYMQVEPTNGTVTFGIYDTNASTYQNSGSVSVPTNQWTLLFGIADPSSDTLTIEKNASTSNSATVSNYSIQDGGDFTIGGVGTAVNVDTKVCHTRVYDQVLTPSQRQTLYDVVTTSGTWTSTQKVVP